MRQIDVDDRELDVSARRIVWLVKIIRRHARFDRQPPVVTDMNESRMCEKSLPSSDSRYRAFVCPLGRLFKFYCYFGCITI